MILADFLKINKYNTMALRLQFHSGMYEVYVSTPREGGVWGHRAEGVDVSP